MATGNAARHALFLPELLQDILLNLSSRDCFPLRIVCHTFYTNVKKVLPKIQDYEKRSVMALMERVRERATFDRIYLEYFIWEKCRNVDNTKKYIWEEYVSESKRTASCIGLYKRNFQSNSHELWGQLMQLQQKNFWIWFLKGGYIHAYNVSQEKNICPSHTSKS